MVESAEELKREAETLELLEDVHHLLNVAVPKNYDSASLKPVHAAAAMPGELELLINPAANERTVCELGEKIQRAKRAVQEILGISLPDAELPLPQREHRLFLQPRREEGDVYSIPHDLIYGEPIPFTARLRQAMDIQVKKVYGEVPEPVVYANELNYMDGFVRSGKPRSV